VRIRDDHFKADQSGYGNKRLHYDAELQKIEKLYPGITSVQRDKEGSIASSLILIFFRNKFLREGVPVI
jgi:hypothetical protein